MSFVRDRYEEENGPGSWAAAEAKRAAGILPCSSDGCDAESLPGASQKDRWHSSPWLCDACREAAARAHRERAVGDARESVPVKYRSEDGLVFGAREAVVFRESPTSWRNIVITGPSGAGKTTLAAAYLARVLTAAIDSGELVRFAARARFVSSYDLSEARAGHPLGRGDPPLVLEAIRASLLVLDDLGAEPHRPADRTIERIIFDREANRRKTVFTSAVFVEHAGQRDVYRAILGRYGEGIARRMWAGSVVLPLPAR